MSGLTFWFDVHSPWVYLASFRVGDIARKHGLPLALAAAAPAEASGRDRRREAAGGSTPARGVVPPGHSRPCGAAGRAAALSSALSAAQLPRAARLHPRWRRGQGRSLRAPRAEGYWAEEADITDLDLLARWGEETGLDGQAVKAAAVSEAFKQRLDANTQRSDRTRRVRRAHCRHRLQILLWKRQAGPAG